MAGEASKPGGSAGKSDRSRATLPEAPLALYRRYRPATFAEVKGQEHVTEPLRQALRSGRVHHAYLFSGPRGCGKTSSARILARSLNCERGPTPDPCGECASCIALAPAGPGSIDVIEIDAASHGGIDDARDLRERAFYSPVSARYKIYIIDEAHMVTGAGFNALLKLVEEPPPHLKFVFATTEPEKVIPTIRSRTHHYPFRLVPPAILRELLEEILAAEQIGYEPAVLPVVIRAGAGSVRDSLSVLDQLIAGADESGLRYDRAIALLGYTDDALLDEMAEAFAARDGAAVFLAIDHVVEAGHDPRRFAMDLLDRLRDLIILAAVPDAASSGLLDAPEDQLERMRKQADGFGQERLARAAETISVGLVEMRGATSPRLLLELMCAQVLLPAAPADSTAGTAAHDDFAARLDRLERQLAAGGAAGPEPGRRRDAPPARATDTRQEASRRVDAAAAKPSQPAPKPSQPAPEPVQRAASGAGTALSTAALRERWPEVLTAVRDIRRTAWILLSNFASIADVEGNVLTMAFDSEGNAKGFASSGSDGYLADVIESMFGVRPVIRAIIQPGTGRGGGRPIRGGRDDSTASQEPGDHGARSGRGDGTTVSSGRQAGGSGPGHRSPAVGEGPATGGSRRPTAAPGNAGDDDSGRSAVASPATSARASSGPPAQPAAAVGKERTTAGRTATDLADDPRLHTDADPPGSGDEVTGTDLIMRELGGQVIGEISEV